MATMIDEHIWVVYLLRCADDTYYCGVTNNLEKRLSAHQAGEGAKYTQTRLPVCLVAVSDPITKQQAYRYEYHIKRLPREKKLAYVQSLHQHKS